MLIPHEFSSLLPLEVFLFLAALNCNLYFFPPFPAGPHEDSAPFRLRKHSLFYSCQLSGAHVETRKPNSCCPKVFVLGQRLQLHLESAPLPDGL